MKKIPAALLGASWHMKTSVFSAHREHVIKIAITTLLSIWKHKLKGIGKLLYP